MSLVLIPQIDGYPARHYAQGSPGELGAVQEEELESVLLTNFQVMPRLLLADHTLNNKICRNTVSFNFDVGGGSV